MTSHPLSLMPRCTIVMARLPSMYESKRLELEPQPELEVPGLVPSPVSANGPEKRISHRRIRLPKARVIGEVEYVRPHFQPRALLGHKRLVKTQIHVVDTVDAQAGKISWSIARILVARVGKAVRVKERKRC